jgi:hypothetical protein
MNNIMLFKKSFNEFNDIDNLKNGVQRYKLRDLPISLIRNMNYYVLNS